VPWEETLAKYLLGFALVATAWTNFAISSSLSAAETASASGAAPWIISNGNPDAELYVPRDIEATYDKGTRSRDGKPGPNYWQNHSVHNMRITVSPPSKRIEGDQEIVYTNNSPDTLNEIIFRMYLNSHQPEAMRDRSYKPEFLTRGIEVTEFNIENKPVEWANTEGQNAFYNVPGSTVHRIKLEKPLPPKASVRIQMRWNYDLTRDNEWKEGATDETSFYLAYFFPRITNYSDYSGWDVAPFTTGREFNNDFADFNVEIDAPKDFLVWATGELQNPGAVLQPKIAAALKSSLTSDKVTTLAESADVQSGKVTLQRDRLIWIWKASNVPDFALGISNHYRWDAASVVVDPATGRRTAVQSAYADRATDFKPMVEMVREALKFASTKYPGVPYPYPKTTIFLGTADEEYPMMVNDSSNVDSALAKQFPENVFTGFVATHEILHSWFPFYMGINEKRYPFMDEGWTTAFEYLRNREVIGPQLADGLFKYMRVDTVGWALPLSGNDLPIVTPHDTMYGQAPVFAFNQYGKAALGYLALKDLMGDAAFKKGLHTFMDRWHGKRPLPWDMFNSFNNAGVGNYNWFFNNWFFGYNYMDIGLGEVRSEGDAHKIQVKNMGGMAMPFDLVVAYADDTIDRIHQTPAVWKNNPRETLVTVQSSKVLRSVTIDGGIFRDFGPTDNEWKADQ
jgi:Peptidase family M1 domain